MYPQIRTLIRVGTISLLGGLLLGCATMVGSPTQTLPISSTPSKAEVLITDERGNQVFSGQTPTSVTLQKSDGSYFGGKSFQVRISKDGYQSQTIPVETTPSGWYVGGNLIFGGLIGWFIVDPLNGQMYNLSPEVISATLGEEHSHNNQSGDAISIMLVQDVPQALRPHMEPIN